MHARSRGVRQDCSRYRLRSEKHSGISEKFESCPTEKTTTSSTLFLSVAREQTEDVVNVEIRVLDDHRTVGWAKFQMCKGLGPDKILGSISRLVESGHPVVFRDPGEGRYTENTSNCYRTYLRQQHVS